jgi:CheY-like chemotaxis protein
LGDYVLVAVSDMLFRAKIRETARQLGREVEVATTGEGVLDRAHTSTPALVLIDLADRRFDALDTVLRLKADPATRDVSVVGFFPHVMTGLHQEALDAGCDRVLPRSAFTRQLASLLAPEGSAPR